MDDFRLRKDFDVFGLRSEPIYPKPEDEGIDLAINPRQNDSFVNYNFGKVVSIIPIGGGQIVGIRRIALVLNKDTEKLHLDKKNNWDKIKHVIRGMGEIVGLGFVLVGLDILVSGANKIRELCFVKNDIPNDYIEPFADFFSSKPDENKKN